MTGCTNRTTELGIPRTQAGRSGIGLGARRPSSRATARPGRPSPRRPRSYAVDRRRHLRHRARPRGWVRCRPAGSRSAPAQAGTGLCHRTRLPTRPGPVPPVRAQWPGWLWAGWGSPYTSATTRVGGLVRPARAMETTRAAHSVLDRRSPSHIAAAVPALAVSDRAAGRTAGPGLPCADHRGFRHCGDGGLDLLVPKSRDAIRATRRCIDPQ
jgi:hypothetical protein